MKYLIFLVGTTDWGVYYPHELIRYCPPIYEVCVSSHLITDSYKANLILDNFDQKNWESVRPPPLLVVQIPNFGQRITFKAPLILKYGFLSVRPEKHPCG